jgi:hypothetical protein
MCCCRPDLPHNEEQNFVLLGNKDKTIFNMVNYQPQKFKPDLSQIRLMTRFKDF